MIIETVRGLCAFPTTTPHKFVERTNWPLHTYDLGTYINQDELKIFASSSATTITVRS